MASALRQRGLDVLELRTTVRYFGELGTIVGRTIERDARYDLMLEGHRLVQNRFREDFEVVAAPGQDADVAVISVEPEATPVAVGMTVVEGSVKTPRSRIGKVMKRYRAGPVEVVSEPKAEAEAQPQE
jgi:hypothetical protein